MARPSIKVLTAIALPIATCAAALSHFDPECAVPETVVAVVSSPDVRGTSDIFWSSAFTIITCTWTIQHLNIPKERTCCTKIAGSAKRGPSHGVWCDVKWSAKMFLTNLKWMLVTIVAPEFILGKAIGEFAAARHLREAMAALRRAGRRRMGALPWLLCVYGRLHVEARR